MKAACGINCPDYALINKGASVGESPFMQDTLIPTFRSATQPQHLRHPPCATLPLNKKKTPLLLHLITLWHNNNNKSMC